MLNYVCLNAAKLQAFQPAECSAATNGEPSMADNSNTQTICCKDSKNFENDQINRFKSFVFFSSWLDLIEGMPDGERLEFYEAIFLYGLWFEKRELSTPWQKAIFEVVKKQIDINYQKCLQKQQSGKMGGAPKGNSNAKKSTKNNQKQPKTTYNVNVNDNVNANDLSIKERVKEKKADFAAANAATLSQSVEVVEPEIVKPVVVVDDKEKRKQKFYNKLSNYIQEYGMQMVTDFFDYWTESNENGKKMRFEMEKVFDINKRLKTWANRQKQFNTQSNGQRIYKTATERTRDEYLKTIEGVYADIAGK